MRIAGVDIGGTKCAVLLAEAPADGGRPQVLRRVEFPTRTDLGPSHALDRLAEEVGLLRGDGPERIGISCGGPLDSGKGLVLSPPNLPGWDGVPVSQILAEAAGGRAKAVLMNDASAGALAEWRWGAGFGSRTMAFLTFGTGIGAGLIIGGRLHEGACGLAGELGHWTMADDGPGGYGKPGSLEAFCSGGGIGRLARAEAARMRSLGGEGRGLLALPDASAREVLAWAREGDPAAVRILRRSCRVLGRALAMVIDLLNPDMIVIGGVYMRNADLLAPWLEEEVSLEALPGAASACRIVPAALGEETGDLAAAAAALSEEDAP